jgi:ABC-type sugar transport system substrate-binding protein
MGNFHQALKPHGYLYFTAETLEYADGDEVKAAFKRAQAAGLPVVYGENPDENVYHYHPTTQQVKEWTRGAGFEMLKEGNKDYYYHLLVQKVLGAPEMRDNT